MQKEGLSLQVYRGEEEGEQQWVRFLGNATKPLACPLSVRVLGRSASSLLFWRTLATHRSTGNWCQLVIFPWGAFNFGCVRVNFRGISIFLLFGTHSEIAFFLHLFERTPEELFWQQIDLKIRKIWFHFHCIVWAQKKRSLSATRPPSPLSLCRTKGASVQDNLLSVIYTPISHNTSSPLSFQIVLKCWFLRQKPSNNSSRE